MKIVFRHLLFSMCFLAEVALFGQTQNQSKDFSVSSERTSVFSGRWFKERSFFSPTLEKGNRYLKDGKYENAIKQYKAIVEKKKKGVGQATVLLAEIYLFKGNTKEAMKWYNFALKDSSPNPKTLFNSAILLRDNGKYVEAKDVLEKYIKAVPNEGDEIRILVSNIEEVIKMEADTAYKPSSIEVSEILELTSPYNESAITVNREMLVLTSNRPVKYRPKKIIRTAKAGDKKATSLHVKVNAPQTKNKGKAVPEELPWVSKMWQVNLKEKKGESQFGAITPFVPVPKIKMRDAIIQGSASFTSDGKTVYFVQEYTNAETQKKGLELYSSIKQRNTWIKPIPFEFNSEDYSIKDPFISSDGTVLYFASDMPGGYGGFDIYMSKLSSGKWEKPVNLGAVINTAYMEVSPLIFGDTVLYFSSDGHATFGGLDILRSVQKDGVWKNPENLRFPINSLGDDVSFSPLSTNSIVPAVFISSRNGESNVFMYGSLADMSSDSVSMEVKKDSTGTPTTRVANSGSAPLKGKVTRYSSGMGVGVDVSEEEKDATPIRSSVRKTEQASSSNDDSRAQKYVRESTLGDKFPAIYFQASMPYVEKISYRNVGDLINLLKKDPSLRVHFDVYSDALGSHAVKQRLSERRATVLADYLQQNGISAKRITTEAHGDLVLVNRCSVGVNCSPREHALNRRAEVKIIYPTDDNKKVVATPSPRREGPIKTKLQTQKEDVSKLTVRPQRVDTPKFVSQKSESQSNAKKERRFKNLILDVDAPLSAFKSMETLSEVLDFLNKNPSGVAEFALHTDAEQGAGIASQIVLMQASSLLAYLKQQGISSRQISLKLFGCEKPLNRCVEGVSCSPKEHSVNRRAEVIVRY
ncbi:MAG: OmpA family protein [Bacteroidales bacterium]